MNKGSEQNVQNVSKKITIANSEIVLELGNILLAKVDVLVNPTSANLQLNWGSLSKFVLESAGPQIQAECTLTYPTGITWDTVAVTAAGKLSNVKTLFHITCPQFQSMETSGKSISKIVTNCLNKLVDTGFSSIAIPSIGAGGLKYPANLVAKSSLNSVVSFLNLNRSKKLSIKLVVYEKDIDIYKVKQIILVVKNYGIIVLPI